MPPLLLGLLLSSAVVGNPKPIDPGTWIGSADYPAAALRQRAAGTVGFQATIDRDGSVHACKVVQSSGVSSLDEATCGLIKSRAHFIAATDEAGRLVRSTYASRVSWVLPSSALTPVMLVVPGLSRQGMGLSRNAFGVALMPRRSPTPSLFLRMPDVADETSAAAVAVADDARPPTDPALQAGQLPNGLHYMVMRNPLPRGGVSIRMRIAAGSIDENDTQRGYAHLLEHMVLRGSAHVADGEFGRSLEQMGLRFGIDSNAHTMPEETTYELDFPGSAASADLTGLFLLREIASRATLASTALNAERGVVAAETRVRDTSAAREEKARIAFLLAGQRIPTRWTEGTDASIASATTAGLRAFYDAHYRPETATIIVAGDIDPKAVIADITADFSDWKPAGGPSPQPDEGIVKPRGQEIRLFSEAGAPNLVEANWVSPFDAAPDTIARERHTIAQSLAAAILDDRLSRIAERPDAPFSAASMQRGLVYRSGILTTLMAIPTPGKYAEALGAARAEQRRLIALGVTRVELDRVAGRMRASIAQQLAQVGTRNTVDVANALLSVANTGDAFVSPAQGAADAEKALAAITPADIKAAAAEMVSGSGALLFASSNRPLVGGETAIASAFAAEEHRTLTASSAQAATSWPYTHFGPPGRIVDRRDIADLGVTIVRFANGTSVTIKSVPQPKDDILADLNFGAGLSGLPPGRESSYWMMGASAPLFTLEGLGKVDATDIADQLSGKVTSAQFAVSDDRFHLFGHTRDEDLDTQLQLLTAYIADPGFRPEPFEHMKALLATTLTQVEPSSALVAGRDLKKLVHGRDPRWSVLPDAAQLAAAKPDDLAALLRPSLAGPLNLVLVGDMSVDKAISAAQSTIGALPVRAPRPMSRDVSFPAAPPAPIVIVDRDQPDRGVAYAAWPTTGFFANTADARSMQVLADIVKSRLIEGLRAHDGLTYAPMVYTDQSGIFAHYGMVAAQVEIAPAKADLFFAEMQRIVADLAAQPVSIEELDRARTPMLEESRQRLFYTNYWLNELVRTDEDPRMFDTVRTRVAELSAVKPTDIQRLAKQYLEGRTPFCVVVRGAVADRAPATGKKPMRAGVAAGKRG